MKMPKPQDLKAMIALVSRGGTARQSHSLLGFWEWSQRSNY